MKQVGGYLKPITAAQYLGIPLEEVQAMIESGELPGIKIAGQWRIPLEELEKWLDEEVSPDDLKRLATHLKDVDSKKIRRFFQKTQEAAKKPKGRRPKTEKPKATKKRAKTARK